MGRSRPKPTYFALVSLATLCFAFSGPATSANTVFKCVKDGKTNYTSDPKPTDGQCAAEVIRDEGPSPEELARLLQEKKLRQEEEAQQEEAALKEREVRAKELEADAESRRARAVENALLRRQTQPMATPNFGYQPTYPYYPYFPYGWSGTVPLPVPRTGLGDPTRPLYTNDPPRP